MPRTRSQKDAPSCPVSRPSDKDATEELAGSEGVTSASASMTSGTATTSDSRTSSGTFNTESTTTMNTAVTVITAASEKNGQKNVAARKETTKKTPEDIPDKGGRGSAATLKPMGVGRHVRSTKTTSSSVRRRELEAREELARLELEQAQAAAKLARVTLELVQYEDEDSVDEDLEGRTAQVQKWIETSILEKGNMVQPEQRGQHPLEEPQKVKTEEISSTKGGTSERGQHPSEEPQKVKTEEISSTKEGTSEIQALATVLKEALTTRGVTVAQPKYIHELPYFDGNSSEWLAFKVVYEDTAPMFNDVQNMARLRKAIKGNAREAIKSLLYSEASPFEVMQALKRRYGRPDALALAELDKVKALPKISENSRDICIFASQINNSVAAIRGLKKPQYLHSPEMVKQIIEKMPTILKFRWYDFFAASEESDFSNLTMVSKFLNIEADKCGAFATSEERSGFKRTHRQATHSTREKDFKEKDLRQPTAKTCPMCEGEHFLVDCQKFQKASVQNRWATVKRSHVCFKCLRERHRKESCRRPPCKQCKRWHHHLLHVEDRTPGDEKTEMQEVESVMASVNAVNSTRAYLKIVPVEVFGSKGSKRILALMDEGSTVSLIDQKVAEEVGAQGDKKELVIETVGGKLLRKKDSQMLDLTVKGVHQGNKKTLKRVRTIDELKLAPQLIEKKRIKGWQHLKIADSLYYERESPQLLIGQDNWELIVTQEIRRGKPGEPVASRTGLGWVLHGSDVGAARIVHRLNSCLHVSTPEEEMHQAIKDHFAIEALGVQPRRPTEDSEGRALAILEKTCRRLDDGRFEAGHSWKMNLLQDLQVPRCLAPPCTEGELHLQAAFLGSRLAHSVEKGLDLMVAKKAFWTDSSFVLSWIKTDPRTFKTFVAHRLAEIEDRTKPQDWRWVHTPQKPTCDATRDVPKHFCNHRWYTGPSFLKQEEAHWPAPRSFKKEITGEDKAADVVTAASAFHPLPDLKRFSSWTRLWRATARVLQFLQFCRKREKVNVCKKDSTWKATQRLADYFWQRWLREYLPTLLPRKTKARTSATDLQVGDIVLIVDHSLPRCTWPRGRILRVYPGPDGRKGSWTSRRVEVSYGDPVQEWCCWCQECRRARRMVRRTRGRLSATRPRVEPSASDMYRHVSTCIDMYRHVSTCIDIYRHVSTCQNNFIRFIC
ncbi:unnamed protein product [Euphydryas editha]|uniref:DUF5641 domain-containing protein n=1 Tax=Euphydryas editha TaxID=104508 RepID=A0AAU9VCS7_EUPED|nr:unnamed protein product [Euphydryas editha]